jgi:hypothetical protein
MRIVSGSFGQLESVLSREFLEKGERELKALRAASGGCLTRVESEIESRFGTHQRPDIVKAFLEVFLLEMR